MAAKLCAFLVWAVVAASAVFWGLRLSAGTLPVPAGAATAEATSAAKGDLLRLFGAAPVQPVAVVSVPAESTRFRLAGVVSPRAAKASTSRNGVALIAVDGKPARAYRVGSRVDGDWVLQSVSLRSATVGASGGAGAAGSFLLELPPLQAPATGTLPGLYPGTGAAAGGMPFAPPAAPAYVPPPPNNEVIGQNVNDTMPGNGPVQTSPPMQPPGRNFNNNLVGAPSR